MTGDKDFWRGSGYHLLARSESGHLQVTDDFLRAYLLRPELQPPEEAGDDERLLHDRLLQEPRLDRAACGLAGLNDPDAVENFEIFLKFRDHLLAARTLEEAYSRLFQGSRLAVPPLFIDHMVHVILRGILDQGCTALQARAAELFFRSQRVTLEDGHVMLADEETVETFATTGGLGNIGRLLVENQTPPRAIELDVLDSANEDLYWARSDRFDTVLDTSFPQPGLDAFSRVLEKWLQHFHGIDIKVEPVQSITDEHWRWHCGLDAASSELLDSLYRGEEVSSERLTRLLNLFKLTFPPTAPVTAEMQGRPIYLGLASDESGRLRMKPQNLLVNLPLRAAS